MSNYLNANIVLLENKFLALTECYKLTFIITVYVQEICYGVL